MSHNLNPGHARHVGPDLGPTCLQKFMAGNTGRKKVTAIFYYS